MRFNHERQLKSREFKARGVKYGGRREIFHDFNVQMGNIVRFQRMKQLTSQDF